MSASTEERGTARNLAIWSLFVAAIFASAFLIFMVEPMVGKRILPWFGGSPGVWILCLAFYQTTLFIGYAYAHVLIRYARPSLQIATHALVVAAALVVLPVLPGDVWRPEGESTPMTSILAMLASNVALPFLVLAATGPLIQSWFSRRYPERSPYPLYAVSNAGSMLALVCYPFVVEPRLPLSSTGDIWTLAFAATAAMVLACAVLARRPGAGPASGGPTGSSQEDASLQPTHVALWFLLSGCAVVALMGATNALCLDIASVPFLWILPLVAYLGSLILCFGYPRSYRRTVYVAVVIACLAWPLYGPSVQRYFGVMVSTAQGKIAIHCLLLFATCMVLHGELYRIRPSPRFLTHFYLCVTAGGALGGIFVGVVAQHIFGAFYELWLAMGLAWALLLFACRGDPHSWLERGRVRWRWGLALSLTAVGLFYTGNRMFKPAPNELFRERTFFGVLRIVETGEGESRQRSLFNGTTLHGIQFIASSELRRRPSSYYGFATGIGIALNQRASEEPRKVGVIGLGAGTLAVYGAPGDRFRFYEVDPVVVRIAGEHGYFSFLADSRAEIKVVTGDGRLSIERELAKGMDRSFDFLIIDAFNSDAIPVHLLTHEAFETYAAATGANGVVALHISNRHFALAPLVAQLGLSAGMQNLFIKTSQQPRASSGASEWVFLSRNPDTLDSLADVARKAPFPPRVIRRYPPRELRNVALWTDDYSDLFGALRSPFWRRQSSPG